MARFCVHLYLLLLNDCLSTSAVYQRNPDAQFSSLDIVIIGILGSFFIFMFFMFLCIVYVTQISEKSIPPQRKAAYATFNRR
jgi:hypothetical protein